MSLSQDESRAAVQIIIAAQYYPGTTEVRYPESPTAQAWAALTALRENGYTITKEDC